MKYIVPTILNSEIPSEEDKKQTIYRNRIYSHCKIVYGKTEDNPIEKNIEIRHLHHLPFPKDYNLTET